MSKSKYYAVRKGKTPGIYLTWDECKKQVDGFSGAEYKSFKVKEEAKEYMKLCVEKIMSQNELIIEGYVDGSYEHTIKKYGSGVVIIQNNQIIDTFSIEGNQESLVSMRNVAGEIEAAKICMKYCIERKIKNLILYFDYEGIEKWCTGQWKTNKVGTIEYKKYYDSIKHDLNVKFVKVKAHSGNEYNDKADILAKQAIGILD